ncbi:PREDICTED: thyroglobulin-like [Thamnophis sirtalis]|uniref:Thyroglobulin-like n=1 Tax=Thamnophis sirtalis TaxID=35019 RepID=A0A6I9Z4E5_9SAUR|nr:PREDICTED: thyroglobulin-like [Thamnophis sirtalis]
MTDINRLPEGITDCQRNEEAGRCDENGQYRPSYQDPSTQKSFCVDSNGKRIDWTETDGPLTDSQCLGQDFTTVGVKTFEKTDFQDVVSGVYSISVVSASGTSLTDVHLFCRQACHQDACCDGFILSQLILDGGSIACSLLSSPSALICNLNDWDGSSTRRQGEICQRTKYNEGKSQYTVRIGDQVLAGASTKKLFSIVESDQILIEPNRSLPSQKYWLFKQSYTAEEAALWCLTRCREDEFCLLADIPNNTDTAFFPCTLYPAAQVCNTSINNVPNNCKIVLPQKPQLLYRKTDSDMMTRTGSSMCDATLVPPQSKSLLSVCSKDNRCRVTTLETLPSAVRCVFYPETQSCTLSLQGHRCRILLKEPATYIYRKQGVILATGEGNYEPSVVIPSQGTMLGVSRVIQVGSEWKSIGSFLGVPYAAPPVGENRFHPPQPFTWTDFWNATTTRSAEILPVTLLPSKIFVSQGGNLPVLVFFHNSLNADDQDKKAALDGAYLAGVGNLIVVTANYRVGVFGFLSTGSSVASGNWGLLDQDMALQWIRRNIARFGGDAGQITIGAPDRGADIISLHLLKRTSNPILFKRALLMGGSAFSPAITLSKEKAQSQAAVLAREVGCPSTSSREIVSCLRQLPAKTLNDAQTKVR